MNDRAGMQPFMMAATTQFSSTTGLDLAAKVNRPINARSQRRDHLPLWHPSWPVAGSLRFQPRKELSGAVAVRSKRATGSALTLPIRRASWMAFGVIDMHQVFIRTLLSRLIESVYRTCLILNGSCVLRRQLTPRWE
jgi:hypothetical protein